MLYNNLIIVIVGIVLVIISLYFIVKQNKYEEEDYYYKASMLLNNNEESKENPQQQIINSQLKSVLHEMAGLKQQMEELQKFQSLKNVDEEALTEDIEIDMTFNHALNYQLFMKKNDEIIKMYNAGNSIDEIAKELNKSFREIEMIIKLIK